MSSSTVFNVTTWPNAVAAVMMLLNSSLGFFFNVVVIHNFISDQHEKSSFNLICVFRAANNIFILVVAILGIFLPATITGFSFYPPIVESILIVTAVNLMVFNEFQGVYLAVNRLMAIYFPLKYNLFFGIKLTFFFHILYYADRVRNVIMETIDRHNGSNYMLFSTEHLAYGGIIVAPDGMFIWAISLIIFPFLVNAVTYVKIFLLKKKASRNSEHWKKAKKNMAQFFQTVLQDSLFSISVIFSLKLNTLIDHRFWTFFTQTFVWQSVHVLDGFIMLMFNEKLSLLKKRIAAKISPADTVAKHAEHSAKQTSTALPDVAH